MKIKSIIICSLYVALMAVFTIYDLDIAKWIYEPGSIFGKTFAILGESAAYVGVILFGMFASKTFPKKAKWFPTLALLVGCVLLMLVPYRYLTNRTILFLVISIILSIILFFVLSYLSDKLNFEKAKQLLPVFIIWFVLSCAGPGSVTIIKFIVGRVRFEDLAADYSNYTRWYIINWFSGNVSFPSGHTCSSATILALNTIPLFMDTSKENKWQIYIATALFVLCTALSRMILGKHYATDVITGFLICYVLKEITTMLVVKNRQRLDFIL